MASGENKIVLGGRAFRGVPEGITIRHDHWLMSRLKSAGLGELKRELGETARAYAERLLSFLVVSDRALELAGGLLLPAEIAPKDWTPDVAKATTEFIGGLTAPEDHETMKLVLMSMLIPFFKRELDSLTSSEPSSAAAPVDEPESPGFAPATANGAASSGYSPSMT